MRAEELIILRGVIRLNNVRSKTSLMENFTQIGSSTVEFSPEVKKVLEFVQDYYDNTAGFPSFNEVEASFREKGDFNLVRNLEQLQNVPSPTEEEFQFSLKKYIQEYETDIVKKAFEKGLNFLQENRSSVKLGESLAEQALSVVNQETFELYGKSVDGIFTSGNLTDYYKDFRKKIETLQQSQHREAIPSGVSTIDNVVDGLQKGDLAFICGYTGAFKTGCCVNWSLSAIKLGYNVLYITMENSAEQLTNQIISSHAANSALFGHLKAHPPSHTDIEFGNLNDSQIGLVESAFQDYNFKQEDGQYGKFFVHQPEISDVTLSYVRNIAHFFNAKCGNSLDMIVIDSPNLMTPEVYSSDHRAAKNHIIRCLKIFALTFNKGKGLSLLCPHQINREGHNRALQTEGFVYDHKCIADLNEIERSSDLVMTIFSDDENLRITNQILFQFLKTRNFGAPKYQNFPIYANMATRRWGDLALDESINYEENFDFDGMEEVILGDS